MVPWGTTSFALFLHKWQMPPINCLLTITAKCCQSWKSEVELLSCFESKEKNLASENIRSAFLSGVTQRFPVYFQPSYTKGDNWLSFPGCYNHYHIHFPVYEGRSTCSDMVGKCLTCHMCRKSRATDPSQKGKLWSTLTTAVWQTQMRFLFFKPSDSLFGHKIYSPCSSTRNRLSNMCSIFFFRCYLLLRSE